MTYLKISNNKVYYKTNSSDEPMEEIDKIDKEDILKLIELIIENEDFSMEEYDNEKIGNKAHNMVMVSKLHSFKHLNKMKCSKV